VLHKRAFLNMSSWELGTRGSQRPEFSQLISCSKYPEKQDRHTVLTLVTGIFRQIRVKGRFARLAAEVESLAYVF